MARRELAIEVKVSKVQEIAKLTASLKELRKEQRELTAQLAKKEKVSKAEAASFDTRFKQINKESEALRRRKKELKDNIAASTKATKSSNSMAKQFIKGAAAVGIVVTAFRRLNSLVSGMITTFTQFEFTMAKVNAVSGATEEEFRSLNKTAEELGRSTFFTAEQVAALQLNFSKLGFTASEIEAAQQATLNLATATGSDLARSASVAGASVRGFGLDAEETGRVVDVMAVAFSGSALDIEKWSTGMTKVAPIAKAAGFSIEDTAAIFGVLSDAGIEASIAGTSLRNILLKMQDPNSDLVKSFGRTIHSLDELVPALNKFSQEGGSLFDVLEVVDQRQVATFEQMLSNVDTIEEFRNALFDANGEGQRMADIIGDTLQGSLLKARSALEGFSIEFMKNFSDNLQSSFERLASFLNELTKFAGLIADVIKFLAAAAKTFITYKAAILATNAATLVLNSLTNNLTFANKRLLVSVRSLTAAMLSNPFALVATAIVALGADFFNFRHQVDETTESYDKLKESILGDAKRFENRQKLIDDLKAETVSLEKQARVRAELERLQSEIAAKEEARALRKKEVEQQANEIFRQGEEGLRDAFIASQMREYDKTIQMQKTQLETLKTADANANYAESEYLVTTSIKDGNKARENRLAMEKELLDFKATLLMQGLLSEQQAADVRKQLIQDEINDLKNLLTTQKGFVIDREKILNRIVELEQKANEIKKKEDKQRLEDEIVTASLSGQNALEAVKSVIRARVMEAVASQISKVITTIPFPANILIAAGAGIAVGRLVDNLLAQIAPAESSGMLGSGGGATAANVSAGTRAIYARGGMVHGKSHAEGGEKFAVGGRVVELEGGEAVINKRSTAMFRNQLSAMNSAGGGVKFADGGLLNMPSFTTAQFDALNSQANMGQQKVVVVEADITDAQNTVSTIQSEATI